MSAALSFSSSSTFVTGLKCLGLTSSEDEEPNALQTLPVSSPFPIASLPAKSLWMLGSPVFWCLQAQTHKLTTTWHTTKLDHNDGLCAVAYRIDWLRRSQYCNADEAIRSDLIQHPASCRPAKLQHACCTVQFNLTSSVGVLPAWACIISQYLYEQL